MDIHLQPVAYVLPLALIGAWMALAIWDIVRRQDQMSKEATVGRYAVILLIPIFGVVAYFIFGRSKVEPWLRWLIVGGGAAAYVIVMIVLLLVSGAV